MAAGVEANEDEAGDEDDGGSGNGISNYLHRNTKDTAHSLSA